MAALGIESPAELLDRFGLFLDEVELWNGKIDLTNAAGDELVVRHVLDSLAGLPAIRERLKPGSGLADIGSGAGFPGIPLALCLPEAAITLVEPSRKRAAFLRTAAALLGLAKLEVGEMRLEELSGPFEVLTFRAFKPLDASLLKRLERVLAPSGSIIAYKGRAEIVGREVAGLREALDRLSLRAETAELRVPFLDEERRLLIIGRAGS